MHPRLLPIVAAALLALFSAACSGSDPKGLTDDGYKALNESNYGSAQASFNKALAQLQPGDPLFLKASLGACQAGAFVNAQKAYDDFLALAKSQTDVQDDDFIMMTGYLANADALALATELAVTGKSRYPESPKWEAMINKLGKMAEKVGDDSSLKALEGLGYSGGD